MFSHQSDATPSTERFEPFGPPKPTAQPTGPGNRGRAWARCHAARLRASVKRLHARTPLRVKLITALLALVAVALAVISFAGVSFLRSYLIGNVRETLQDPHYQTSAANVVERNLSGLEGQRSSPGTSVSWLSPSGNLRKVLIPISPSSGQVSPSQQSPTVPSASPISGPDLSRVLSQLEANPNQPIAVRAVRGGGHWEVVSFPEFSGLVIVGDDLNSIYGITGQLTEIDAIVGAVVIIVLAAIGVTVVRSNLRPLDEIEETAQEIADGHLDRRVPDRDPRTEVGSLGRSLNTMLAQLESGFQARQESEAAARQSEERMRQFIADASHELRTPLAAIQGYAELTRQDSSALPPTTEYALARIESEARRMTSLVDELLLLSRLGEGEDLDTDDVDLSDLVLNAINDAAAAAPTHRWVKDLPDEAVWVRGDRDRLHQLVSNLLSNASVHTPPGTTVTTRVASRRVGAEAPCVELTVTDDGPGIDPDLLPRLFERFVRADKSRSDGLGNGLGLAIVASIVKAHHGSVVGESADGQTVFRVRIPMIERPAGEVAVGAQASP